jgi:OFA family oxalate/formate antiporter-like MFS transporter
VGPRTIAIAGAILYGGGTMLASLSANHLQILYLTYCVIGGVGLGFAYIVPVAILVKWFPDRRVSLPALPWAALGLAHSPRHPIMEAVLLAAFLPHYPVEAVLAIGEAASVAVWRCRGGLPYPGILM